MESKLSNPQFSELTDKQVLSSQYPHTTVLSYCEAKNKKVIVLCHGNFIHNVTYFQT